MMHMLHRRLLVLIPEHCGICISQLLSCLYCPVGFFPFASPHVRPCTKSLFL
jgi:hypothetical protein